MSRLDWPMIFAPGEAQWYWPEVIMPSMRARYAERKKEQEQRRIGAMWLARTQVEKYIEDRKGCFFFLSANEQEEWVWRILVDAGLKVK